MIIRTGLLCWECLLTNNAEWIHDCCDAEVCYRQVHDKHIADGAKVLKGEVKKPLEEEEEEETKNNLIVYIMTIIFTRTSKHFIVTS